jgi:mRNA (guanine-N7-)-methyltransferase
MYQSKGERAKSYFYNMRRFHNAVKRQLYDKYTKNIGKLLDLACGKGGDLDKWVSNNIGHVIGYDINEKSITEAKRRVNEYRFPKKTEVELYVKDLSRNVIEGNGDCDVVTSMFAFHYFFETKETFDTIMKSIDNNLKPGGCFIGTMFDGESIKNILKDGLYTLKDGDDIKFNIEAYKTLNENAFGNKIGVYLKDTVLDEPMDEYVVYFDKFVEMMKLRGYELEESKMFEDIDLDKSRLNDIEKKISYLNRYFVFKRVSSTSLCKQESGYLMECDWPQDVIDMKRQRIINKYKKALDNKIMKASPKAKMDYIYLRDNFEKGEQILNDTTIDVMIRNYYKKIYDMFLDDLNK